MDEPFGALDAMTRDLLHDELEALWTRTGLTVLFVTHNVREAVVLADRVFVMSAAPGRLLEEFRIHTARPRDLDDVLVGRVVSEIHQLLMQEVDESVAREMAR
jgi:NitT/TauT family transport system ATP-binding protein